MRTFGPVLLGREGAAPMIGAPSSLKKSCDTCPDRSCSGKDPPGVVHDAGAEGRHVLNDVRLTAVVVELGR